jgi:hypothetical protein
MAAVAAVFYLIYRKSNAGSVSEIIDSVSDQVSNWWDMITTKVGVSLSGLRPQLQEILQAVSSLVEGYGIPFVVTSTTDSHAPEDVHSHGFAFDLRVHGLSVEQQGLLSQEIQFAVGSNYYVLLENAGESNEHIHIQLRGWLWKPIVEAEGG